MRPARALVAGLLVIGGGAHFVVPDVYARIVPEALGSPRAWVYGSGVAEVVAGGLLAAGRTRRLGGWVSAVVLVAVFPANLQHAVDGGGLLWARLPLQVPLVWWALQEARRPDSQVGCSAKRANNWASSSAAPDRTE